MRTLFLSCLFVATAAASALGQSAPPVVILFVGNSYTMGAGSAMTGYHRDQVANDNAENPAADKPAARNGGVPAVFKQLADEAGLAYEVHSELSGGKSLEWHYKNALPIIAQARWNAVVLQGFSTEPVPAARGGKPDNFVAHATLLEQEVHKANPKAKVYLYETFPRSDQVCPNKSPYHDASVDAMASDLHDGFAEAFTKDGHFEAVAPAGDAWRKVFASGLAQLNPYLPPEPGKLNLWAKDNHHASLYGSYLNTLVIFETITGHDVTKFGAGEQAARELGVEPEIAVKLQGIAHETVSGAPHARK